MVTKVSPIVLRRMTKSFTVAAQCVGKLLPIYLVNVSRVMMHELTKLLVTKLMVDESEKDQFVPGEIDSVRRSQTALGCHCS